MVDMLVTTADAVEADLIRCLSDIYVDTKEGYEPRSETEGVKRRGNTMIPNEAYHKLYEWFAGILPEMVAK